MVDNNPYINNLLFKAKPNYEYPNVLDNNFNQFSKDQITNKNFPLDVNINNNDSNITIKSYSNILA